MKEVSTEEFRDVVKNFNLEGALKFVDADNLKDQQLRTMCRKFQQLHDDIMYRLENESSKLSLVQE